MRQYQITVLENGEFDLTRIHRSGDRTPYDCSLDFESDNFRNR